MLGGTNLRVCLVHLQGNGKFEITQTKYRLTEEQKQDEGEKLFDFCAECVANFVELHTGDGRGKIPEDEEVPLGFTVSVLSYLGISLGLIYFPNLYIVLLPRYVRMNQGIF